MTYEEAKEIFSKVKELPCGWCYEGGDEFKEALNLAVEALTYKAKIKKYGSELAMAYAEKAESDAYLKELNERHRKVFGKTLDELEKKVRNE